MELIPKYKCEKLVSKYGGNYRFRNFISQADSFKFIDMEIAIRSSRDWSYPTWPSHIDHILINYPLFDESDRSASEVRTLRVDDYLEEGWTEYEENISDHRPVAWKFKP